MEDHIIILHNERETNQETARRLYDEVDALLYGAILLP
jgi:hypothetical protein